ncbi:hypothetical protein EGW08_007534 [Elysia chlorotica]|uniref:Uncharacterized protein n=1 Tax=Elysia chlorotica TaxID=188477 RepID=A0A3S1C716_ELYCH|nr:hypothetical protein EGW08_007534 [Elysia chlorotica]
MRPQTNNQPASPSFMWLMDGMMEEQAEPRTPSSAGKTSWRIQEASKLFASMRTEYEESKKLFIPLRYHKLEELIEMFTAEAITQKLRYLATSDSQLQYSRALYISQSKSNYSHSLASPGAGSTLSSVSSSGNIAARTGAAHMIESCDSSKQSSRTSIRSMSPVSTRASPGSLWWRRQISNRSQSTLNDQTTAEPSRQSEGSNDCKTSSSASPSQRRRSDCVPSVVINNSYSDCDGTVETNSGIKNSRSAGNLGQACSKAYNFVLGKINPTEPLPNKLVSGSLSSLFSTIQKEHQGLQRSPLRFRNIVSTHQVHDFYIPCLKVPVHRESDLMYRHSSPKVSPRRMCQREYSRRASESLPSASSFSRSPLRVGSGSRSSFFTAEPLDKLKHCGTALNDSEIVSAHTGFCNADTPKHGRPSDLDLDNSMSTSIINRGIFSEEQIFAARTVSSPREFKDSMQYSDGMIDNIVLTIAYDHITNLRNEYSGLHGMNFWRRYKKMKTMIKRCMNVLKSD